VRVFANVCPHRGSRVVEDGPGHADVLICPYHRWAFRTDGSLVGAPFADEADLDGACLVALRHVEWKGFVLVNPSGDAPEPFDDLAGLDDHLAPWRWDELVTIATKTFESEWNWKVMVENWIECYHHLGAHRETVEPFWAASAVHLLAPGARPWAAMTVEGIEGTGGPAETWIPGMDATKARDLSVWSAFPLLLGGGTSGHAFWLQIEPLDVTHHRVTWHLLAHPDRMLDAAATDALMEEITMVHVEDMGRAATCRPGSSRVASRRSGSPGSRRPSPTSSAGSPAGSRHRSDRSLYSQKGRCYGSLASLGRGQQWWDRFANSCSHVDASWCWSRCSRSC